jgi:flagellin-like hook-associated protein FlgL
VSEHADEQVLGFLSDRLAAAKNEADAARHALEGAQNRVQTAESYLSSVEDAIRHAQTKGQHG